MFSIGPIIWVSVADNDIVPYPFLPGDAHQLMALGQFNTEAEIMIGTTSDEGILNLLGTIFKYPGYWDYMKNNIETFMPKVLFNIADESDITEQDVEKMYTVIEYYFGSVDNINEKHISGMVLTEQTEEASLRTWKWEWEQHMRYHLVETARPCIWIKQRYGDTI